MIEITKNGWIKLPQYILNKLDWQEKDLLFFQQNKNSLLLYKKETNKPTLFIRCFGHFSVEYNNKEILIKNKKLKEMLAFLASSNNEFVNKWTIAQQLWPDSPKNKAMDCLYKVLNYFSKGDSIFREIPVEIYREQIRMCLAPHQLDIKLFEILIAVAESPVSWMTALELYRGGFLEFEYYEWSIMLQMKYEIQLDILKKIIENY